jgi:hypothetical protein
MRSRQTGLTRLYSRLLAFLLLIAAATPVLATDDAKALLALTPAQMRADLAFLRDVWAKQDKSFSAEQSRAFDALVADASAHAERLDPVSFWMVVSRALALSRNGHTNVNADDPPFPGLPFAAWWFKDGLYIVAAAPGYSNLLGARIERIGKLTAEQALTAVAPFISGNDRRIRAVSPLYLRIPALLHRLGMAPSDAQVRFTLRTAAGERTVTLSTTSGPPVSSGDEGWSALIPAEADVAGRWPHVLDSLPERPLTYRKPVDIESRWLADDRRILYLRSNEIDGDDGNPFTLERKLLDILAHEVIPEHPRYVIVDLRLNSGGNFLSTIVFSQALPQVLAPEGKVLVLVGPNTFSAAIVTAAMLIESGGSSVQLLGTGMADNERFWAEGSRIALPNSRLRVKPSFGFQDWGGPCPDPQRCFWANVVWGPKRAISLEPHIKVEPTFAEYATGRDPVLDEALRLAR